MRVLHFTGVVAFAFMLASCSVKTEDTETSNEEKVFPVKTQTIKMQENEKTLEYAADLIAYKEIHRGPASPGRIEKIHVEVGDRVSKGQVLVEMERTNLSQTKTQLEDAKINFQRIDTLYHLGSISKQQYDQAKSQYEILKTTLDFTQENTTITSSINGIVTGRYFENGEIYLGSPNSQTGKAGIVSIMQINPLKANVYIPQSYFPDIKNGLKATIRTDIYEREIFTGKVSKVYPTINPSTRTFQTEIEIENNAEKLRPGMFATIVIDIAEAEALMVPSVAILKQEGTNNRLIFVNDNGVAKQIFVKIGKRSNEMVEIMSDEISEGMQIITEGQANLLNGSKVKVIAE